MQGTNEAPEVGTVSHESLSRISRATTQQEMHSAMSFNSSLHKSICKSTQEAIRKSTWWLCGAVIQAMTEFLNGFLVNPPVPIQHKIRNTSSSLWGRRVMAIRCGNTFLLATQHQNNSLKIATRQYLTTNYLCIFEKCNTNNLHLKRQASQWKQIAAQGLYRHCYK